MSSLLTESWIWYGFAVLLVLGRYVSRYLQLGSLKDFQTEDYVMLIVMGFYTSLVANMNTIDHLDTNLMLPSDIPLLTPESIQSRIRGSKLVLVVEQSMIMTQWGCKICLLLLYNKLTFGLAQQFAVKVVGAYVVVNWVVMEILYLGIWCRPFHNYWAVPTPNEQCSAAIHHLITNTVFNISSDLLMLFIPLPLLLKARLPFTNKLILCVLFSLGIFVILCAVLNKYYSFAHPFSPKWEFWYIREASTAIYVANMPMCWSLVRRVFNLRAFDGNTSAAVAKGGSMSALGRENVYSTTSSPEIGGKKKDKKHDPSWWDREPGLTEWKGSDSEEYINRTPSGGRKAIPLEIWQSREVDVDVERPGRSVSRTGSSRDGGGDRGMRSADLGMFDGSGAGLEYESKTTIIAASGRKAAGSLSRNGSVSSRLGTR